MIVTMSFGFVTSPALSEYADLDKLEFEKLDEPQDETVKAPDPDALNSNARMSTVRSPTSSIREDSHSSSVCEDSNPNEQVEELDEADGMLFEKRFDRLLKGNIKSDCKFVVGPQKNVVEGHKLIFSMASEVFYAMFYGQLKEDSIVRIEDLQLDGFEGMKKFIYTGHVNFTSALQACSTFVAARKYLIPQLSEECINYIKSQEISPSEVLRLYEYCKNNEITEIEEKCRLVMQEKTREVVNSEYFLSANSGTMDTLLKFELLDLESEQELFNYLERWAVAEAERQNIFEINIGFNNLKKYIRFLSMNGVEFTSGPAKSLMLTQEEKLAILLNIMYFNSTPLPDYFDASTRKKRKFKPLNSKESGKEASHLEVKNILLDQAKFKSLLTGSIVSDCEFIVGPQQNIVKGHKLIFSMASKIFQKMFNEQLKEDSIIKIDDLELDGFEGMKHFIYTGDVSFNSEIQACLTYIASQKYSIPQLGEKCIKYMENRDISPLDVLKLYEFCRDNNIPLIVEKCIQIIQEKTKDVVKSEYFSSVDINTIDTIMSFQELNFKSEIEVFSCFERWALAEARRRGLSGDVIASTFNSLKKHIRFLTMKPKEFAKGPALSPLLTQEEKLNIGLNIMDLGSAPYPENFSLSQHERNSTTPLYTIMHEHENCYTLVPSGSIDVGSSFSLLDSDIDINVSRVGENICFGLNVFGFVGNYFISLKTKLRVLATDKKYDDLLFETECSFGINEDEKTLASNIEIYLAVIPWDKVNRACFIHKSPKRILIEGSFVLQALDRNGLGNE